MLSKFISRYKRELCSLKSLLNGAILGNNFLPKSYQQLGGSDQHFFSNSLQKEMNWQVLAFLHCSEILNLFLKYQNEFEHNLMIADYPKAREILDKIEHEICVSFWSTENRFIIDEYEFGTERNWETRNLVLDDKYDPYLHVLGNFYSLKTEKRVSFFQYNEEFNNWLETEGLNDNNSFIKLVEFLRFKGNYFSHSQYNWLDDILFKESNFSIVDRYICFIRIAQHVIVERKDVFDFILPLLKELSLKIEDISLTQMSICINGEALLDSNRTNTEVITQI